MFDRRKPKSKRDLRRRPGQRKSSDRVLIVCEGSKTEPYYFNDARNYHKLSALDIHIKGAGRDPSSLVMLAKDLYRQEDRAGNAYDRVYCVFDKDQHTRYAEAIAEIRRASTKATKWYAITSVPAFEFWLLLHFQNSTSPYSPSGGLTASQVLERDLKQLYPVYQKGMRGLYSSLIGEVEQAIRNAQLVNTQVASIGSDNPSTQVHELVEYIMNIKG